MISRKRKTLYYGLLLVMSSLLPLAIYAQNAHAYQIIKTKATYRMDYWDLSVEVTLDVQVNIYQGGDMSFFYSKSYSQSKPWYSIWWGVYNYADLYEESPDLWTAKNARQICCFGLYVVAVSAEVHFNENDLNFYYSDFVFENGGLVSEHIWSFYGSYYDFQYW